MLVTGYWLDEIARLLDDAQHRSVPARVGADRTEFRLRQVEAVSAEPYEASQLPDRPGQGLGIFFRGLQQMEREPLCSFPADAGQFAQFADDALERWSQVAQDRAAFGVPVVR